MDKHISFLFSSQQSSLEKGTSKTSLQKDGADSSHSAPSPNQQSPSPDAIGPGPVLVGPSLHGVHRPPWANYGTPGWGGMPPPYMMASREQVPWMAGPRTPMDMPHGKLLKFLGKFFVFVCCLVVTILKNQTVKILEKNMQLYCAVKTLFLADFPRLAQHSP